MFSLWMQNTHDEEIQCAKLLSGLWCRYERGRRMTREEKEQTGKYILQMARLLKDGCYQQEMLLKAVRIIDEALEQEPTTKNDLPQLKSDISIDEAIKDYEGMKKGWHLINPDPLFDFTIDILRKYQKIEEIVKQYKKFGNIDFSMQTISGVVEDGKID